MARVLVGLIVCLVTGCGEQGDAGKAGGKKVLVLGCDGMDPVLVERLMTAGRMPNFVKLRDEGGFCPLTTSIPPQSPVAWSNFIAGAGPGVHGIFDFIHRDLKASIPLPYWSGNEIVVVDEKTPIKLPWPLDGYQYPRTKRENHLLRRGVPFWEHLDANGIPAYIYRIPADYPPSPSPHGNARTLGDMGVPDAMGSQGTYQHYSTRRRRDIKAGEGYKLRLTFDPQAGGYKGRIYGPPNEFHVDVLDPTDNTMKPPDLAVELRVYPDDENDVAKIVYVNQGALGDETVELILNVGDWSNWQDVTFLNTPVGPSFRTMARFLLQEVHPQIRLYVSPLNFIPTASEIVFSEPPDFVAQIGEEIGPFYTQGFAEEFNALKHKIFTDEEYRIQSAYVLDERLRILDYALDHFEEGFLFFYFSSTDLQAHMFWWDSDDPHPVRSPDDAKRCEAVVEDVYCKMDAVLGECRERLGPDATILVISDHGFGNFRRGIGVNTWLRDQGYLVAQQGLYIDCDWSRTKAYSVGVGGSIYLNLKGRESSGVVDPADRDALLTEMSARLMELVDPQTGRHVFRRIYRSDEWYHGAEAVNAPDLVLGYERGYRSSWRTCLGDFDDAVVVDNTNAWSADHCIAHDLVPGILLSNRPILMEQPALVDVGPTVLSEFGVPTPAYMTGRSFLKRPAGGR